MFPSLLREGDRSLLHALLFGRARSGAVAPARKNWALWAFCLLLAVGSTGCGVYQKTQALFGGIFPIDVRISPDLNQNSPVAMELVVVYDKKILAKLLDLSAREWFQQRGQFAADHQGEIDVWSWEWVPGQVVETLEIPYRAGAKNGLLFADFYSPGQHRLLVDHHKPLRIVLSEAGFTAEAR